MITVLKATAPPPDDSAIRAAAERLEPSLRDAFLAAVRAAKDKISIEQIVRAIRAGNANQALAILSLDKDFADALRGVGLDVGVKTFQEAVREAYIAGARGAMEALPTKVGVQMSFDLMNPESTRFLASYDFKLIREISEETRQGVQQIIMRAFKEGGAPEVQAREIRSIVGLTARMEQAVANYRKALETGSNASLKQALQRSLRDGRYDKSLLRALSSGRPLPQAKIDTMVERYRQRYLMYRARNIARTESLRASGMGQRELWRQAREQGLIDFHSKRRWVISGDERTCPICLALDGKTVGMDEEFDTGIMDPPDPHPSCRCDVVLVPGSTKVRHGTYGVSGYAA